jgi:hypothetical protein
LQNPSEKKERKKEARNDMTVDTDWDFIKWSFGKAPVIPEKSHSIEGA